MRAPENSFLSPVTHFWCAGYVLALLSIYTCIAGFLARNRDAKKPPQNQSEADAVRTLN